MKRGAAAGYTILEVMIVMAVTAALFIAVALTLAGRQAETEFTQAVRDYEAKIQTMASDVGSGFYETGSFNCTADDFGNPVDFSTIVLPINDAGTNHGCVFLGKIITGGLDKGDVFTLAGRQFKFKSNSGDVVDIADTKPRAVYKLPIDITNEYAYKYGLQVKGMYTLNGASTPIGGFGFITELGGGAGAGSPITGSRGVVLYSLINTTSPNPELRSINAANISNPANLAPAPDGVRLCFTDGGKRRGEITVGANNSQTSTFVTLNKGVSAVCNA